MWTSTISRKRCAAAAHKGTAFVEIYQNCKIFNDGVFDYASDKATKADHVLYLEHGKPLIFGTDQTLGIRLRGLEAEVVSLGNGVAPKDLVCHDEQAASPVWASLLSQMAFPDFPECVGVFRCLRRPTHDELSDQQINAAVASRGRGTLDELFEADDVWDVQ